MELTSPNWVDAIPMEDRPRLYLPEGCISPWVNDRAVSKGTRKRVYTRDGFRCFICDRTDGDLNETGTGLAYLTLHHLYPRTLGGCNHMHNLLTLCMPCNGRMGTNPYLWRPRHHRSYELAEFRRAAEVMAA